VPLSRAARRSQAIPYAPRVRLCAVWLRDSGRAASAVRHNNEGIQLGNISRPSDILAGLRDLTAEVIARADEIESARRVPKDLSDKLAKAGAYRMIVPRKFGGEELNLIEVSEVLQQLAYADGSAAWSVMVTVAHSLLLGLYPADFVSEFFRTSKDVLIRGGVSPGSTAVRAEGGYVVKGKTALASGAYEHRWVAGHAILNGHDGRPQMTESGAPQTLLFLVPSDQTQILPTWDSVGLRGTCSDDIVIPEQFVPQAHTTGLTTRSCFEFLPHALGLFTVAPTNHASVSLGIALGALDDLKAVTRAKRKPAGGKTLPDDPVLSRRIGELTVRWKAAAGYLKQTLFDLMENGPAGTMTDIDAGAMSAYVQNQAIDIVNEVFALAGVAACYNGSLIQRRWRDIRCLGQHIAARTSSYQQLGNLLTV
jgi:alkylation response protein AidB-like acyl-CoA dehydrogenase